MTQPTTDSTGADLRTKELVGQRWLRVSTPVDTILLNEFVTVAAANTTIVLCNIIREAGFMDGKAYTAITEIPVRMEDLDTIDLNDHQSPVDIG